MSDKPCSRENGFRVECIKHYADIEVELARLKGRVIALEAELESEKAIAKALRASDGIKPEGHNDLAGRAVEHCLKLQAEVERLRKAGDAMYDKFEPDIDDLGHNYGFKLSIEKVMKAWNAAKEGKPSV